MGQARVTRKSIKRILDYFESMWYHLRSKERVVLVPECAARNAILQKDECKIDLSITSVQSQVYQSKKSYLSSQKSVKSV